MFYKNKSIIGIDLGNSYIKLAKIEYSEEKQIVTNLISHKIPPQIIENGIIQYPEELADVIRNLLEENSIKCKEAYISLTTDSDAVLLKTDKFPNLKKKEMDKAIESVIFEDDTKYSYNYTKINEIIKDDKKTVEILISGYKEKEMNDLISTFNKHAKIKLIYAEQDIFSTLRFLYPQKSDILNENTVIVDLGLYSTRIAFINNGHFYYQRKVANCVNNWITLLREILGLNQREAEEYLSKHGAISNNRVENNFTLEESVTAENLIAPIDELIEEIKSTIEFCEDLFVLKYDKIVLTGGGANLKGLIGYMKEFIPVPIDLINLETIKTLDFENENLKENIPTYANSIGVAIKGVRENV